MYQQWRKSTDTPFTFHGDQRKSQINSLKQQIWHIKVIWLSQSRVSIKMKNTKLILEENIEVKTDQGTEKSLADKMTKWVGVGYDANVGVLRVSKHDVDTKCVTDASVCLCGGARFKLMFGFGQTRANELVRRRWVLCCLPRPHPPVPCNIPHSGGTRRPHSGNTADVIFFTCAGKGLVNKPLWRATLWAVSVAKLAERRRLQLHLMWKVHLQERPWV